MNAKDELRNSIGGCPYDYIVSCVKATPNGPQFQGMIGYTNAELLRMWFDELWEQAKKSKHIKVVVPTRQNKLFDPHSNEDLDENGNPNQDSAFQRFAEYEHPLHVLNDIGNVNYSFQCLVTSLDIDPCVSVDAIMEDINSDIPKEDIDMLNKKEVMDELLAITKNAKEKLNKKKKE